MSGPRIAEGVKLVTHDEMKTQAEERTREPAKINEELQREIEDRKRAEKALREETIRNEAILQTAMDGFCVIDIRGEILKANYAASEILGYSIENLVGTNIRDFETTEAPEEIAKHIDKVLNTGSDRFEIKHCRKDGEMVDLEASVNFLIGKDDGFFSCFFHDITARKQAEKALRERETALEARTNELKEVNSALRVLLRQRDEDRRELEGNVVLNVKQLVEPYVDKLKRSPLNAKQRAYLSELESSLNDIVSPFVHELTSKYLALTPREIEISHLVREGKTTKEVAELLNLSARTIEFHRRNIRTKIGIKSGKASLRSHLLSVEDH